MQLPFLSSELLEPTAPLLTAAWKPAEPQDPLFQNGLSMSFCLGIYPLIFKEVPSNTFSRAAMSDSHGTNSFAEFARYRSGAHKCYK